MLFQRFSTYGYSASDRKLCRNYISISLDFSILSRNAELARSYLQIENF